MFEFWQIALILLYTMIQPNETASFCIGLNSPIMAGWYTGLVLGNPEQGLYIGGTLQLMTLGVATYGGMSIPNTVVGAIIGTAMSLTTSTELALGVAIPVATFMIQLDILRRYFVIFLSNVADALIEKKKYDSAANMIWFGVLIKGLVVSIPVALFFIVGQTVTEAFIASVPTWALNALRTAGGVMPVVGIVVLMRYLPLKRYWYYLVLGFLMTAYLKIPMIALAFFGLVIAFADYTSNQKFAGSKSTIAEGDEIDE